MTPTELVPDPAIWSRLTDREREVFAAMCCGASDEAIGRTLGMAAQTVHIHVGNIAAKTRAERPLEYPNRLCLVAAVCGFAPPLTCFARLCSRVSRGTERRIA